MHITLVAGTRPNFVKIAPLIRAIKNSQTVNANISYSLLHTGQHYDKSMSYSFFEELDIPEPNINLNVGSGTQAEQTAAIMIGFEKYLLDNPTDLVLVVGDVTSTMACSIVTKKLNIKLAHVEGGIRSFDNTMPEEINRKITDSITDYFFTTSEFANRNLKKEGIEDERIFFVGNVMIDSLIRFRAKFKKPLVYDDLNLSEKKYLVMTLHRPSNVDDSEKFLKILDEVGNNSNGFPIIFPIHPRTLKKVEGKLDRISSLIRLVDPLSYLEFNFLVENSFAVITDSGGITEETTFMKIPCLTLRDNTERPETCYEGTNQLVGSDSNKIAEYMNALFTGNSDKNSKIPQLWDGKTSERIITHLIELLSK